MTAAAFIILLFASLLVGLPIFIAMMFPCAVYLSSLNIADYMTVQSFVGGMNKYTMLCVPFFILAANVMGKGAIGPKLLKFCRGLVGHMYGGIALTAIVCCVIVGAISGAAAAGILIIGAMIYKEMLDNGYDENFASGLITSVSAVGSLIPPSIVFVLYAMNTNTSVLKLFTAGVCSGVLWAIIFAIYSAIYAKRKKLPLSKRISGKEFLLSLKDSAWALGLPVVILGGMYSGLFSPTEAAAASAVYAIFVEMVVYKDVNFKQLLEICIDAAKTCAAIFVLLGAGQALAYTLTISKIPMVIQNALGGLSQVGVLLLINVIFLIAGMFVGPGSAIVVLIPMFFPLAQAVGIDPIHLGNIVTVNLAIGMFTPPFGINLFTSIKVFKMGFQDIVKGCTPFIVLAFIVLALITFIPELSTWLPDLIVK